MVTGVTAASFAWSHQLPELQRLTESELGVVGFPGPPGAQWARASMYWAAFRGTRHPATVADVINFLTTQWRGGHRPRPRTRAERQSPRSAATPRAASPNRPSDGPPRSAPASPTSSDRRPRRRPKGHAKVRTLLVTAAERIRVKRDGTREATARFLSQAIAALAA